MIGERIKALREKSGKSQEDLAGMIGMGKNTVARWEREELTPRGTSLAKLAKALDTTSMYLLGETDNPASLGKPITLISGTSEEKRLIIKNNDVYVNLPETPDGFEMLRRFF